MRASSNDAVAVLGWGLRRYSVLFIACLLLGAVLAPLAVLKRATPAEAHALVIAQRLDMDLNALPRYGEAVFNNGEVARAVATSLGDLGAVNTVIPERVSLLAEQDSIVFRVVGRDLDPQTAADLANVAAGAFVQALNAVGAGAGVFGLQSPAEPPDEGNSSLGVVLAVPVGLIAGMVLGLAVVSVILVARRPVLDAVDAEDVSGVAALGTVTVPRTRRGVFPHPEDFSGLVPVCRLVLKLPASTLVVISQSRDASIREQVSVAMASVLTRVRDLRFVGPPELQAVLAEREVASGESSEPTYVLDAAEAQRLTLVDSREPLDLVQPTEATATVLIVRAGIRSTALRAAVVEHLGGSAEARILLVKRGHRSRHGSVARQQSIGEGRQLEAAGSADKG
jgi:capsular polysaccharide biosynthesis protein